MHLAGFESALSRVAAGNAIGNNAQKKYVAIDSLLVEVWIAQSSTWEMEAIALFVKLLFFCARSNANHTSRFHDESDIFAMFSITERRKA